MPCNSRGGVQTDLFGQVPHPASPSQSQGKGGEQKTRDICGQSGQVSSGSANLQLSLESRLLQLLGSDGSMEYRMHWKDKVTPAGRRYCQLVASSHPTSVRDFGGWPTPIAEDNRDRGKWDNPVVQRRVTIGKSVELSMLAHSTGTPSGSPAVTGRPEESPPKLSLNPAFSLWLMGYPKEWMEAGQRAMARKKKK